MNRVLIGLVVALCCAPAASCADSPDVEAVHPNGSDTQAPDQLTTSEAVADSGWPCDEITDAVLETAMPGVETQQAPMEPDDTFFSPGGCIITGGGWRVRVSSPDGPNDLPAEGTQPFSGVDATHIGQIQISRSGTWTADLALETSRGVVIVRVVNQNRGSDTYSPAVGPPQREPTEHAISVIANALA